MQRIYACYSPCNKLKLPEILVYSYQRYDFLHSCVNKWFWPHVVTYTRVWSVESMIIFSDCHPPCYWVIWVGRVVLCAPLVSILVDTHHFNIWRWSLGLEVVLWSRGFGSWVSWLGSTIVPLWLMCPFWGWVSSENHSNNRISLTQQFDEMALLILINFQYE